MKVIASYNNKLWISRWRYISINFVDNPPYFLSRLTSEENFSLQVIKPLEEIFTNSSCLTLFKNSCVKKLEQNEEFYFSFSSWDEDASYIRSSIISFVCGTVECFLLRLFSYFHNAMLAEKGGNRRREVLKDIASWIFLLCIVAATTLCFILHGSNRYFCGEQEGKVYSSSLGILQSINFCHGLRQLYSVDIKEYEEAEGKQK